MEPAGVAVATITLVRSAEEEPLLRRALERLSQQGLRVAVADGGSPPEFLQFLRALPGITVAEPAGRGLIAQVRASLDAAAAHRTSFVLYTEPDKEFFFEARLRDFIARARDDDEVGVVIAGRSAESFATFPPFQRLTESTINRLCAHYVDVAGDFSYGPFLMRRTLLPHLQHLPADAGWGWRPFVFATAPRIGLKVVHVNADYPCPPDQRTEDDRERVHRMRQLSQNVDGLIAAVTRPLA